MRRCLWEKLVPKKAPVSDDVKYQILAERLIVVYFFVVQWVPLNIIPLEQAVMILSIIPSTWKPVHLIV